MKTLITAHNGCEGNPMNSLEYIKAAIASGADFIETDIRMEEGGRLYLSHDLPNDTSSCVSFETLLDMVCETPNMRINCDVKTEGLIEPVMELAKKRSAEWRILFTGQCNEDGELISRLGGELWYSLWEDKDGSATADAVNYCKEHNLKIINPFFGLITPERIELLKENGLAYSAWTPSTEADIRPLLEAGIANITTRAPLLALKLRKEIQGE